MIDQEVTIDKPEKKEHKAIKRIFLFLAVFVFGMIFLASCTKAFTSDSDKANQMYAAMYGQDTSHSSYDADNPNLLKEEGQFSDKGKQVLQTIYLGSGNVAGVAVPNQNFFKYVSMSYTIDFGALNNNVPTITPVAPDFGENSNITLPDGLSKPQQWLNDNLLGASPKLSSTDQNNIFGEEIVQSLKYGKKRNGNNGWADLNFSKEEDRTYFINTFQSAKAVTLFAGYTSENNENKISLWKNMNEWVFTARADLGIENAPADGFVTYYQQTLNNTIATNRAGLNTSGNGGMYGQKGNQIYIQNKTWGEAFSQYGFLEGLLVWPIGWLVNTFVTSFGAGTGWAELAAIFLVTVIVRAILVVFSIFTSRSQTKMTELQPEVAQIQARYPNAQTDAYEKQAMTREVNILYKKHKVKPWLQFVVLIFQFPIFICVWAALEGSATLSSGNFFGVELTARMSDVIMNTSGAIQIWPKVLACVMLGLMFIAQFLAMSTGQWFNKWKTNKFVSRLAKPTVNNNSMDPAKMGKWMNIIMMVFMVFMGVSLPAGMSMYWFFGALISIIQVFITEAIASHDRHKKTKDGDSLSAIRRSKHHDSIRRSR